MTSVGEILRSARESQGRTAAELAEELCITQRYLRALEQDDLGSLPGVFFYRSFVRQYAALLGIPAKSIEPALQAGAGGPAEGSAESTSRSAPVREPEPLIQASNTHFGDRRIGMSIGMLAVVLVACSGVYAWWSRPPRPKPARSPQITIQPAVVSTPLQPVAAEVTPSSPTVAVSTESDDPNHVVLNLSATEDTWIKITSNGKEIFSGILRPSQTKTLDTSEMAKMKVGNAGGLEVRMNGKSIGPLGERGQVREILFTAPDNVQILEPPAPPPPDTPL